MQNNDCEKNYLNIRWHLQFTGKLYKNPRNIELRAEAESLAEDQRFWIVQHVEPEVRQLNIDEDFCLMLGRNLTARVLGRRPVLLKHIKDRMKQ
ncbi:hypothetical protein [Flavobacterium sp. MK4S-17]|uniref:hypothetical protein n=1 Tax=Flavobacterium sp. MK4S-17 TaxID=2543737 RepID=UPI00135869BF|nr:hypothetical protein [Flavobacterium sp. MK4S-17]